MEATNLLYRDPALYDVVQSDSTSAEMCQTLIDSHGPNARTLVDFGCGTGRDLEILAKRCECIGVDLQPGLVDYAHRGRRNWTSVPVTCAPYGSASAWTW
ncbi:class I SAM-dependent methyltransferase [Streptomyces sp. NPDC054833]